MMESRGTQRLRFVGEVLDDTAVRFVPARPFGLCCFCSFCSTREVPTASASADGSRDRASRAVRPAERSDSAASPSFDFSCDFLCSTRVDPYVNNQYN